MIHCICSHSTPPVFDGPENRNGCRNHDEIRLLANYVDNGLTVTEREYIVDDEGKSGGLDEQAHFVILGDLNADPDEGEDSSMRGANLLIGHSAIASEFVPKADQAGIEAYPDLDRDDTAEWGMRVDYVLPSMTLRVLGGGIDRPEKDAPVRVSDHFLVWVDLECIPHDSEPRP